jgi:AcrR family transcriptional regulator
MGDKLDLAIAPSVDEYGAESMLTASRSRLSPAARKMMDAGIALFADVGFLATTIRDLTGSCGLTAPSFYNHFESKEALLYEIVNAANSELDRCLDALPATVSPADTLTELVRTLVTFNLRHPKETRISNREWVFLREDLYLQVSTHRRRVRAMFEQALASPQAGRGLLDGIGKPMPAELEPRLLAMSIVNLSIASSEWYHPEGPLTIDEVAEAYCRLAVRMAGFSPSDPKASKVKSAGKAPPRPRRTQAASSTTANSRSSGSGRRSSRSAK